MACFSNRRTRRGFTLTELAIVLGIMGIVMGAIWLAAGKVYQNNRLQVAVKDLQIIVQGYRSLFNTHYMDTANGQDITCLGENSGFFPADMFPGAQMQTCVTGTFTTYPNHPWNSYIMVISDTNDQAFNINWNALPQQSCNQLAQQIMNAPGILYESINGTQHSLPPLGAQSPFTEIEINTLCIAGSTNTMQIGYKAR